MEEWNILRTRDASSIKVDDEDRRSTEEAIALAKDAHKAGKINEALESLGLQMASWKGYDVEFDFSA